MCPIVPIFRCGLFRSNFSFAICLETSHRVFKYSSQNIQTKSLERGTGFEPATIALEERDSTVELPPPCLPKPNNFWSLGPGLNRWPRPYQGRALPSELPR